MIDANQLKRNILNDMRVELADEFDKNFDRKGFFTKKWKQRANPNAKGSLLMVTGTMRRSIKAEVKGNGVRFSSAVPYAAIHNEGGKGTKQVRQHARTSKKGKQYTVRAHTRKFTMPKRQFVGDGKQTQEIIKGVIADNIADFNLQLSKFIKK
jgi:phage virion morphogenesis family|nr:MAG TPA: virion morphogenesis protein [Caudoviricetes sp.]